MGPRHMLVLFGIIITLLSLIALMNQGELNQINKITGKTISEKIQDLPDSSNFYFAVFLILGIIAAYIGFHHRKVVY